LAGRKDEYVKECFKDLPSLKDGYSIDDCKDPRHRRLLAFLVPIVYPEKPNRITVTWGNTIYKQVEIIPWDQSGLNYGHSAEIENPEK
jgi:hypothetical protein